MNIGTAKPSLAERQGGRPPPDRHHRAERGLLRRALRQRRRAGHLGHPRAGSAAAGRRRHHALCARVDRGTSRHAAANAFVRESLSEGSRRPGLARAARAGWWRSTRRPPARLHPEDGQRIQRALEVFEVTGETLSEWHAARRLKPSGERFRVLAMMPPERADLHRRIDNRVEEMMAAGLLDEVTRLYARGDLNAGAALGARGGLPPAVGPPGWPPGAR